MAVGDMSFNRLMRDVQMPIRHTVQHRMRSIPRKAAIGRGIVGHICSQPGFRALTDNGIGHGILPLLLQLLSDVTAINRNGGTGDKARARRTQPDDQIRDFLRCANPAHRVQRIHHFSR